MVTIAKRTLASLWVCLLLTLSFGACASKGKPWLTDMEQAKNIAEEQNKDIFMFFTGSDWCGPCIQFEKKVLDTPVFLEYARKNLVLVELDFPQDEELISGEQLAHNEKWMERFGVGGFPTVFLTDASVTAYARTGNIQVGPEKYVEHLDSLKSVPERLAPLQAKADSSVGLERIKYLDQILDIEGAIVNQQAIKDEIVALLESSDVSSDDLKSKYISKAVVIKGDKEMQEELDKIIALIVPGDDGAGPKKVSDRIEDFVSLIGKYSYVKDGNAINTAVNMATHLAFTSDENDKKKVLDTINKLITSGGYSNLLAGNFHIAKAGVLASLGRMGEAELEIDQAAKLSPEKEGYKESLMTNMKRMAERFNNK